MNKLFINFCNFEKISTRCASSYTTTFCFLWPNFE